MRRSQTVFYNFLRVERSELEILVVAVLQRSQAQSMCGASMQSTTIGDGDENEGDRNLDGYCWLGADLETRATSDLALDSHDTPLPLSLGNNEATIFNFTSMVEITFCDHECYVNKVVCCVPY